MIKEQLYFKSIDDTFVENLEDLLNDAKHEGLKEVTFVKAIPAPNDPDNIWCMHKGDVEDRDECRKSTCAYYESKSGRGVCKHRGTLYHFGEEVKFNLEGHE